MADQDEDWKAFLAATELDDDDVETPSEEDENLEDEDLDDEETDPKKKSTKSGKKGGDGGEGDEEDEDEGDDPKKPKSAKKPDAGKADDDDEEEDPKKPKSDPSDETYKPRLTQFLNDKGELDPKKIEEAYINSSKEGVKLNTRVGELEGQLKQLLSAIAADPDVAKKILGEDAAKRVAKDGTQAPEKKDPIMADYEAKMVKASHKEYDDFVEAHPEAVSDPEKARMIGEYLEFYGPWYQKTNNGEIAGMKDSLEAAYRHYGWELDEPSKPEKIATAARDKAATRSTPQGKKSGKSGKDSLTKQEAFFAKKLGVKL